MTSSLTRLWREDDGVLSFEWTLIVTLLTFGIVAGLSAARDAIIDEFGDAAEAMLALDQSMTIDFPLQVIVHNNTDISSASNSSFVDAFLFTDCDRNILPGINDQSPHDVTDGDS